MGGAGYGKELGGASWDWAGVGLRWNRVENKVKHYFFHELRTLKIYQFGLGPWAEFGFRSWWG